MTDDDICKYEDLERWMPIILAYFDTIGNLKLYIINVFASLHLIFKFYLIEGNAVEDKEFLKFLSIIQKHLRFEHSLFNLNHI